LSLPDLPPKGDVSDWLAAGESREQLEKLVAEAETHQPGQNEAGIEEEEQPPAGVAGLPMILITTAEQDVNDQAIAALGSDQNLFQRGELLVRLLTDDPAPISGIRWSSGPRIQPLPRELLRERMAAAANWVIRRGAKFIIDRPPGWCINAVHARAVPRHSAPLCSRGSSRASSRRHNLNCPGL
jgi:hypothetical protein